MGNSPNNHDTSEGFLPNPMSQMKKVFRFTESPVKIPKDFGSNLDSHIKVEPWSDKDIEHGEIAGGKGFPEPTIPGRREPDVTPTTFAGLDRFMQSQPPPGYPENLPWPPPWPPPFPPPEGGEWPARPPWEADDPEEG